jgi:hypothetical protein
MTDHTERKFLDGTASTGAYLIVALRGDVALGIRPLGMVDGASMSAPGKSYLHARLRSARAPVGMAAQYADDGGHDVVKLGDQKLGFDEAWPELDFAKLDDSRASTIIGVFLRGSLKTEPEVVLQRLEEQDFLLRMADYVAERAGHDNLILRPMAIAAWLHEQLDPGMAKLKAQVAAAAEFAQHVEDNVEMFGFQSALLAKLYKKHMPTDAPGADDEPDELDHEPDFDPAP